MRNNLIKDPNASFGSFVVWVSIISYFLNVISSKIE
jgi:hypothetical protein